MDVCLCVCHTFYISNNFKTVQGIVTKLCECNMVIPKMCLKKKISHYPSGGWGGVPWATMLCNSLTQSIFKLQRPNFACKWIVSQWCAFWYFQNGRPRACAHAWEKTKWRKKNFWIWNFLLCNMIDLVTLKKNIYLFLTSVDLLTYFWRSRSKT